MNGQRGIWGWKDKSCRGAGIGEGVWEEDEARQGVHENIEIKAASVVLIKKQSKEDKTRISYIL